MAGHVSVGTICRIDDAMVSWDGRGDGRMLDMYVSQEEDEDLYYALVLEQVDVNMRGHTQRLVRCLALGFETGPDNTFWMLGSQHLKPL